MFPSRVINNMNSLSRSRTSSSTNLWESRESTEQVLVTLDKTFVLVQSSCSIGQGQKQKETLLFDVPTIPHATDFRPSTSPEEQPSTRPSLRPDLPLLIQFNSLSSKFRRPRLPAPNPPPPRPRIPHLPPPFLPLPRPPSLPGPELLALLLPSLFTLHPQHHQHSPSPCRWCA